MTTATPQPDDADSLNRPNAPTLNPQTLSDLALLDPGGHGQLVPRVLNTFLSSMSRLLQQFQQALAAGDMPALRLAVHTLKSSSASIGALQLSACCANAELAVREGRLDEVERLAPLLLAESERVDAAVRLQLTA